mmetsp:Transcript_58118/g.162003  ORF Transcript_58118/g.162003 Transcript_58118/m.162003 type:complete len:369 (-) Transcript_58118:219-1325(-)
MQSFLAQRLRPLFGSVPYRSGTFCTPTLQRRITLSVAACYQAWHADLDQSPPGAPSLREALRACGCSEALMASGTHYTYACRGVTSGRWYIGARTVPRDIDSPWMDVLYAGSPRDLSFRQEAKYKIVLTQHASRKEAVMVEIALHAAYDVARNTGFANRAKQTAIGFDSTGAMCSEATRQKLRIASTGRQFSEETKQKIRMALKGRQCSDDTKQKIRMALQGKTHSEETKQKFRLAKAGPLNPMYGKRHSEETKQKMRMAHAGKRLGEETKQKLRKARQGKQHSEEAKQKMSMAHTGKRLSEETKQKLRMRRQGEQHGEETKQKQSLAKAGKSHSEGAKQKMRMAHTGERLSEETKEKLCSAAGQAAL